MNVISLFDGMSCGQIALNELGISPALYYASEIDQHAIKQTKLNFPNTIHLGDVTKWKEWNIDWASIDLVLAGSPCQGFSFAGKQLAFDDPRSKLFFVFVEILNHIKKHNPNVRFLLENVNMKKEYLRVISEYVGVFPVNINSNLVSAQNRERWYWTNIKTKEIGLFNETYSDINQPEDKGVKLNDIIENGFYSDVEKSYCIDANYKKGSNFRRYFFCGSRQIVFQNGYTPSKMTKNTANEIMHKEGKKFRILTANECAKLQTIPDWYKWECSDTQIYRMCGNGWTVEVIKWILSFL